MEIFCFKIEYIGFFSTYKRNKILKHLKKGHKILAVKEARTQFNFDLKEAVNYVKELQENSLKKGE